MKNPDIILAVKPIIKTFDDLSISYYISGSIASSIYGMARATMDVDIVAAIESNHILPLRKYLEKEYYIDENIIADAIRRNTSFNLIHLETMIKIDVFIHKNESYQQETICRKRKDILDENDTSTEYYFSSPEDIIIHKLQWYEMGGRISERQWLDVIGVIKVQGASLDKSYLKSWSEKLRIIELLKNAFSDAGVKF